MKNRLHFVLGILLVGALGGLWWWAPGQPRQAEPVYEGRPISYWMGRKGASDSNAVPFLVKALKRDSWFGQAYYRKWLWPKLPLSIQTNLPPPVDNLAQRRRAATLLGVMGAKARPAIPALAQALREDEEPFIRALAAMALGKVGGRDKTAIAALSDALRDKDGIVRQIATNALRQVDPAAAAKAGIKPPSP
jgi:hypothetical protein